MDYDFSTWIELDLNTFSTLPDDDQQVEYAFNAMGMNSVWKGRFVLWERDDGCTIGMFHSDAGCCDWEDVSFWRPWDGKS